MTTTFNARRRLLAAGLVLTGLLTLGSAVSAGAAPKDTTPASDKAGKACTVTGGANSGKSGTYTVEEGTGSLWCEGSWGGTECTGTDKCKDAARITTKLPTRVPGSILATMV